MKLRNLGMEQRNSSKLTESSVNKHLNILCLCHSVCYALSLIAMTIYIGRSTILKVK